MGAITQPRARLLRQIPEPRPRASARSIGVAFSGAPASFAAWARAPAIRAHETTCADLRAGSRERRFATRTRCRARGTKVALGPCVLASPRNASGYTLVEIAV